ncbi:MAG: phage portal protein, partial [Acidimicrobiales bacterium]|nr:phage portal protein [Acidimicrobiales bacterium]
MSMLPFHAYRDVDGVGTKLDRQPQILTNPSTAVRPVAWKAQFVVSQALWGNFWAIVASEDALSYPTSAEVADPGQVTCEERPPGRPMWRYAGREIDADRLLHAPGRYVRPGSVLGLSPLDVHRDTWGLAQAARRYGAEWFRDGAHPSAILSTPVSLDENQAKTMKERFMAAVKRRREPAVLSGGVEYTPIQGNPSESQMIEVEDQVIGRVARVMGVPAEMIGGSAGSKSSVTYANRE